MKRNIISANVSTWTLSRTESSPIVKPGAYADNMKTGLSRFVC